MNWPLTFYVADTSLPENCGGTTTFYVIRIPLRYKGDESKYRHELQHVKQMLCLPLLHDILYSLYKPYRQWAEAQAYKVEMKYPDLNGHYFTLDEAALQLSTTYDLGITTDQARAALQ
jgi:hypothetical protein